MSKYKNISDYNPEDMVCSCPYIESGVYFALEGVRCCVNGTMKSPIIASAEDLNNKTTSYEKILQHKIDIFEALNGNKDKDAGKCANCANLVQKKFKDVNLENIGGSQLPGGFGIQHYTTCNLKCTYCCFAQNNDFKPEQYDILYFLELFNQKGKLKGNNWIDFSGGEPALLKNIDNILDYFSKNNLGTIVLYSNGIKYSQKIYDLLKENKIILTTSVDTGLKSTYATLRGGDKFPKLFENLLKYRESGTHNMWLKYVICDTNRTEDDLWSFITTMVALRPDKIMICPDFPYDDKQIPKETVEFAAKLWCECERFLGVEVVDYTGAMGDFKFVAYRTDLKMAIDRYRRANPYVKACMAPPLAYNVPQCEEKVDYKLRIKQLLPKLKSIIKMSI